MMQKKPEIALYQFQKFVSKKSFITITLMIMEKAMLLVHQWG
jgi:hypothetical protein